MEECNRYYPGPQIIYIEKEMRPEAIFVQCFTCGVRQEVALSKSAEGVRVMHPVFEGELHYIKWILPRVPDYITTA